MMKNSKISSIPSWIYKAKNCCDLNDVNNALGALKDHCQAFGLTIWDSPIATKRYNSLIRKKVKL